MKLLPVALAIFVDNSQKFPKLWVQERLDDGPMQGLWEFPGGGIEPGETPLVAAVREVLEEVGIEIDPEHGKFMGIYPHYVPGRTILLYVHLFPKNSELENKGRWLEITPDLLSAPYRGMIPPANHRIIDDLFHHLKISQLE